MRMSISTSCLIRYGVMFPMDSGMYNMRYNCEDQDNFYISCAAAVQETKYSVLDIKNYLKMLEVTWISDEQIQAYLERNCLSGAVMKLPDGSYQNRY